VFENDPKHKHTEEDAFLAEAWKEFVEDPEHRPDWVPRLPMVKAGFQVMRAVQEFAVKEGIIPKPPGWVVAGASKRGWTTFLSGAVQCPTCPAKIVGIVPMVPIIPDMWSEVHRQWQSYGGFTFAFEDYKKAHIINYIDKPEMKALFEISDPIYYFDQLEHVAKYIMVSSDDEFMSMDWSNMYFDKLKGEKHLAIMPNSEHSLATGIFKVLSSVGSFVRSLAAKHTANDRPDFSYQYNPETGELGVTIPEKHSKGV
jgi:PhoPQ-activated pathogenicity-related protein